jgi:hypothetical protein
LSLYRLLIGQFFTRFFDKESLSPQGEPEAGVIQTLGILAVPGAFLAILCMPLGFVAWSVVAARLLFVLYSMIVMSFIVVYEWDVLFPDRRDYLILTPIPIPLHTLFLAKAAALAIFVGLFLADVNFFSVLFWPGVEGRGTMLALWASHTVVVFSSGLFAAMSAAAAQGLLITLFRGRLYRRVSVAIQTVAMGLLVMLLFLSPLVAGGLEQLVNRRSPLIYWFPPYWFAGLYEQIRPVLHPSPIARLGAWAVRGLAVSSALFLLTYLPGYRRHSRRVLETETIPLERRPRRASLWLLRDPVQRAVFAFITQSITRSVKHRLFLATYGGFGGALAVFALISGPAGRLRLPLTLSFVLISGLRAAFSFPSELGANWCFRLGALAPAAAYGIAMRKWIAVCALGPLFLLVAPLELLSFSWPLALFHLAYGLTLSLLLMELMFLAFRKVPFTCSRLPGKVNLTFLAAAYVFGFTAYSRTIGAFEELLSASPVRGGLFLAAAGLALATLYAWRSRAIASGSALIYDDGSDPVVRTLGLTPE